MLLVTGSRSLEDPSTPIEEMAGAKEAFLSALWSFADDHPAARVLVVGGEARGPDAWAKAFVKTRISLAVVSKTESDFEHLEVRCDGSWKRIRSDGDEWGVWHEGRAHPLDRNTELVRCAAELARGSGEPAWCLGVLHARSKTGGTMDTIRKAREAGCRIETIRV